jgi:hypothetical protein
MAEGRLVMFELKPLSREAIPAALSKAERYRLLNEPDQAESICLDILAVDPDNREALVMLLLALTDQFPVGDGQLVARAQALVTRLDSPYERSYFSGVVAERRARAILERGSPSRLISAGTWMREAMAHYERAESGRPSGNDEARLRWNACARLLNGLPEPADQDGEPALPVMLE